MKGKRCWTVNTEPSHETSLTLLTQRCLLLSYRQIQYGLVDAVLNMAPVLSNGALGILGMVSVSLSFLPLSDVRRCEYCFVSILSSEGS